MLSEGQFLLAVYDITGIQEYIFASNRMKENVGASFIVGEMVKTHFVDTLKDLGGNTVITPWDQQVSIFDNPKISAEVVYIGGGNAVVIYRESNLYHKVNRKFALRVIEKSASLTMVTEAITFTEKTNYAALYQKLMRKLDETKSRQLRTKLNQKLPVFAREPFKGNAITQRIDQESVSTEQYLKQKASALMDNVSHFNFETKDLKKKKGQDSYVAVVHIDGNGIGDWIKRMLSEGGNEPISTGIQKHRELSRNITEKFRNIFNTTVEVFREVEETLPMRPLIIDGDDITFICQADLAIPFTQVFLKNLEATSQEIRACAGVAFVHSHFPFDIAYEIAESCCQNAKAIYYEEKEKSGVQKSYFDFYIVRGSYVSTMSEQRNEQGSVAWKLYDIDRLLELQKLIVSLNYEQGEINWPRSRLTALHQAYLESEEAVKVVKDEALSRGYVEIHEDDQMLFDALQLIDFGKEEEWTSCLDMS